MTDIAIDTLAAYRLTRLIQTDTFPVSIAVREFVRKNGSDTLLEMMECPWCLGFWVSAGVASARAVAPRQWSFLAKALATSAVVGVLANAVAHLETEE